MSVTLGLLFKYLGSDVLVSHWDTVQLRAWVDCVTVIKDTKIFGATNGLMICNEIFKTIVWFKFLSQSLHCSKNVRTLKKI